MMVTLTDIVDEYIIEREQDYKGRFAYFLALAKMGLNIIHREATGTIKQVRCQVLANGSANLPKDCVKIARVFVLDRYGCVIGLSQTDSIVRIEDQCGDIYKPTNHIPYTATYPDDGAHTRNGYNIGAYYGTGGDSWAGLYQYNQEYGRLDLSSHLCARFVIVHYIGLPEQVNNDFLVHPYFTEALKDFIDFKSVVRKSGVSQSDKMEKEDRWIWSKHEAKKSLFGLSESQVLDAARHNFSPTPKT